MGEVSQCFVGDQNCTKFARSFADRTVLPTSFAESLRWRFYGDYRAPWAVLRHFRARFSATERSVHRGIRGEGSGDGGIRSELCLMDHSERVL